MSARRFPIIPDAPAGRRPATRVTAALLLVLLGWIGCIAGDSPEDPPPPIVVNSLEDVEDPPDGTMTLRGAIGRVVPGGTIRFDPSLAGGTIDLRIAGSDNSVLKGEIYDTTMTFRGYGERNYGKSALYARKDLAIDASALPGGITLRWTGDGSNPARVMAVYGDLTLRNVTVTGGRATASPLAGGTQPYTLARGGGIAVWGTATLSGCTVGGNRADGDLNPSRDRGAFGGGIYANALVMDNCVVAGNAVSGYGAAGGGVYSVGGADGPGRRSTMTRCAVSGNRVTAQHAYGGGVFSLGGGPDYLMSLDLTNCTVAGNLVEDHPDLGQGGQFYYRGGGVYIGGGLLSMASCTVAGNGVIGPAAVFGGKPNTGGGGVAATIGNAHVVESMDVRHSIVAGNRVNGAAADLFTGSLLHFFSGGHNRIGRLDVSQILVPVPPWYTLSRRHWPKAGDTDDVAAADVLSLGEARRHASIVSEGTDRGEAAVLWYPPAGSAVDGIPAEAYDVFDVMAQYAVLPRRTDDFPASVLEKLRTDYGSVLGNDFGRGIATDNVAFHGPAYTWPSNPDNQPWIRFWRDVDAAVGDRLGAVGLGDAFWGSFSTGPVGDNVAITVEPWRRGPIRLPGSDQRGDPRPRGPMGDVGAIER